MPRPLKLAAQLPHGERRSRAWSLATGGSSRDLYVRREGAGQYAHLSLHDNEEWHLAAAAPNGPYFDLEVTPEARPGIRHALAIVVAPSACILDGPAPGGCELVGLLDYERCAVFDLFTIDAGCSSNVDAPGAPSWRFPIGASGAHAVVFARAQLVPPTSFEVEDPDGRFAASLADVEAHAADHLQVMQAPGGPIVLLDGAIQFDEPPDGA